MSKLHQQRFWLGLLTAILLSMQSLAIWHDAEHAFHESSDQCERYEAFAHTPALDAVSSLLVVTLSPHRITTLPTRITPVISKQRDTDAIRAPPIFLS